MDLFPNSIPHIINLCSEPLAVGRPWRNWIARHGRKAWILPHAARRFKSLDSKTIYVFTSPLFPRWLAHLLRQRLLHEHYPAPSSLLASKRFAFSRSADVEVLDNERLLFLSLGIKPGARDCALRWIRDILEYAAVHNRSVQFVPLIFLWNRSPERPAYPPAYGFLTHRQNNLLSTGYPLTIEPGVTPDIPSPETVRRNQIAAWNQESRVIVGDRSRSIRKTTEIIQSEPTLKQLLASMVSQGKDTLPTLHSRVAAYVREIATDYYHRSPWIWELTLGSYLRKNFESLDFDRDGLDRLRILLRQRKCVILVPSHRSHLDYILISYAIYKQGLACPLVAAGANLNFWPMGFFFRKTGAFFIRRTFRGLDIYPHVFRTYLWMILRRIQPVEFFIEGGRSRTGVLLPAKLGFLNMILEAYYAGNVPDVHFVPLAVNYDRIPEEDSYVRELKGSPKQKEKISSLLRSRHLLKRRFGKVCFAIGQPVSLTAVLSETGIVTEHKGRVGATIMNQLRFTMPVTSTALIAAVMMAVEPGSKIQAATLIAQAKDLLEMIREIHPAAVIAEECLPLDRNDPAFRSAIARMLEFGNMQTDATPDNYRINPDRRFQVDYLRNSLIGLLLAPSLAILEPEIGWDPSLPSLHTLLCPGLHPIPTDVIRAEIRKILPLISEWQPERRRILSETLRPLINLMKSIFILTGSKRLILRELSTHAWRELYDEAITASGSKNYPEICSKPVENDLFRVLRQATGSQPDNSETDL